ncbi:MAG TPA: hypothetical protein VIT23_08600 [Terrimicrobiaceae bacterium]
MIADFLVLVGIWLGRLAIALIVLPILLVFFTPWILIGAFFMKEKYSDSLKDGYRNLMEFWLHVFP